MIGATVAGAVYRGKVHIGFLAAIVAAANAGGSGSVVGDTTTTMMWLDGISPLDVLHAYVAAVAAFFVFAIPAARQQQRFSPIEKDAGRTCRSTGARLIIVVLILAGAIAANVYANRLPRRAGRGVSVHRRHGDRHASCCSRRGAGPTGAWCPRAAKGSVFLLSLVLRGVDDAGGAAARRLAPNYLRARLRLGACSTTSR